LARRKASHIKKRRNIPPPPKKEKGSSHTFWVRALPSLATHKGVGKRNFYQGGKRKKKLGNFFEATKERGKKVSKPFISTRGKGGGGSSL